MRKLIFKIKNDDDFQLEGSNINKDLIFFGTSDKAVLEKLQRFIENSIRKIIVLGSSAYDGKVIKSFRGQRIIAVENYLAEIYKAAGELKDNYNIPAGNWFFGYKIQ